MFCRQCGTLNAENAPTCTSYGNALSANPYDASMAQGPAAGFPGGMPMEGKPKNYLVESILVTFCCCLPLGIVGIVFASQVDS